MLPNDGDSDGEMMCQFSRLAWSWWWWPPTRVHRHHLALLSTCKHMRGVGKQHPQHSTARFLVLDLSPQYLEGGSLTL